MNMRNSTVCTGIIAAVLFLCLSALLYHAVPDMSGHYDRDSIGYERIARQFLETGQLTDPAVRGGIPIQPIGYPLFIGALYKLFGPDARSIILIQILLSLLCIWLIFVIAWRLFGPQIARITLFLSAINLGFFVYAQLLLAETLMLTFLLLFFERLTAFMSNQKLAQLAQAGLILGLSVLIKPMALLYIFLLLPFIWFCMNSRRLMCVSVLLVSFYLPLVSYMGYNYATFGYFRYAPMTSLNIYQCYLSKVIAHVEQLPVERVRTQTLAFTGEHGFDESGWDTGRQLFGVYAKKYPFVFVKIWCVNVLKTLGGLYATQLKLMLNPDLLGGSHSFFKFSGTVCERCAAYVFDGASSPCISWLSLFEVIFNFMRWILVFLACFLLVRGRRWCLLYLFGTYMLQCVFVTGIDGCCRYRMTFEPILIILAAIGIYALYCLVYKKEFVV